MQQQRRQLPNGVRHPVGDALDSLVADAWTRANTEARSGSQLEAADNEFIGQMTRRIRDPWLRRSLAFMARLYRRNYSEYMAHPRQSSAMAVQFAYEVCVDVISSHMDVTALPEHRDFLNFEAYCRSWLG